MNKLIFDIETVPDVEFGRRTLGLEGIEDKQVAQTMFDRRREETGSEFLPLEQQHVVAISVVFRSRDVLKVSSLGDEQSGEKELIQRFYDGIGKSTPDLVSWNGAGFDLPVLHYRALKYGIQAPRYWETGDEDQSFRWNNYLNRFHSRHLDLMDVLSGYQNRARAGLDNVSQLIRLPGKFGMHGNQVWEQYQFGQIGAIRNYCETDVINTYLVYLRFELMRGVLSPEKYDEEVARMRSYLESEGKAHFKEYLEAWSKCG